MKRLITGTDPSSSPFAQVRKIISFSDVFHFHHWLAKSFVLFSQDSAPLSIIRPIFIIFKSIFQDLSLKLLQKILTKIVKVNPRLANILLLTKRRSIGTSPFRYKRKWPKPPTFYDWEVYVNVLFWKFKNFFHRCTSVRARLAAVLPFGCQVSSSAVCRRTDVLTWELIKPISNKSRTAVWSGHFYTYQPIYLRHEPFVVLLIKRRIGGLYGW